MLKGAIVGFGFIAGKGHHPAYLGRSDVEIAAICDLDAGRLNRTADTNGVERRYADYRRMVEECAPDGVYVIGPPPAMYDIWIWCLQQGLKFLPMHR